MHSEYKGSVHARAPVENVEKAHMRLMHVYAKSPCTPKNDAFMILVGLPPTSGSAPKSI
jgi:hypothetical protein